MRAAVACCSLRARARDFSVILACDVSRWGRFQDTEERAFDEYLRRRADVVVVYCAEQFSADGSPMAVLLKGIRRIMAAEYSRELSEKVFLAQSSFVRMGHKQGSHPGYGCGGCRSGGTANAGSLAAGPAQAHAHGPRRVGARR